MEHAQRVIEGSEVKLYQLAVLILILMEHAQRAFTLSASAAEPVLILILMEHAQRVKTNNMITQHQFVS